MDEMVFSYRPADTHTRNIYNRNYRVIYRLDMQKSLPKTDMHPKS